MNRKYSKFWVSLLLACGLIFLISCGGNEEEPENPDPDTPQVDGDDFEPPTGELDGDPNPFIDDEDDGSAAGGRPGVDNPSPEIIGDTSETEEKISSMFENAATLEELLEKYPELGDLMSNLDLGDRDSMAKVYEQMMKLYDEEGVLGMQTFLDESGISASLGLDSTYIDFVIAYENEGWEGAEELARRRRLITQDDELRMILVLDEVSNADAESGAEALGVNVLRTSDFEIEVGVPLELLRDAESSEEAMGQLVALTRLPHVVRVRVPRVAVTSQNDILNGEGPEVTSADEAHDAGITGAGVKVGIIDPDGFFAFQDLQEAGRLPNGITVMPGQRASYLNDDTGGHGTACAEIVHEMAPDAQLYIAHAQSGLELEEAVEWMIDQGVQIINYSAGNISVPTNNSTPWTRLVTEATDAGILWVNSSGNFAESHLYMEFTDEDGDGLHEFPNGEEFFQLRPYEGVDLISLGLSWDDSWGRAENDYDLYLLEDNAAGDDLEVVVSSRELQDGDAASYPSEYVDLYAEDKIYYVAIEADGGAEGVVMNLIGYSTEFRYSMPEYSVTVPGDSPDSLTVGATYWSDDALEPYSSQGPTLDGRDKPEISAPAGVSSTVYQGPFFGTSASAPHVAGAAALVLSTNPDLTPADLRSYLIGTSLDFGPRGYDMGFGFGRVDMEQLADGGTPTASEGNSQSGAATGDLPLEIFYAFEVHNVEQGDEVGMVVKTSLAIVEPNDYINETGTVELLIEDESGDALLTLEEDWRIKRDEPFLPLIEQFVGYDSLNLPKGRHDLQYTVSLLDGSGATINTVEPVGFFIESAGNGTADGNGAVQLSNIEVVQDVTSRGVTGIGFIMDLEIQGRAGKETEVAMFFYQDTSSEPLLRDFNDEYASPDGYVATWTSFVPDTDDESWEVKLFIPNDELHLAEDTRYNLKSAVFVYGEPDWAEDLAISDWIKFRVDTGDWE